MSTTYEVTAKIEMEDGVDMPEAIRSAFWDGPHELRQGKITEANTDDVVGEVIEIIVGPAREDSPPQDREEDLKIGFDDIAGAKMAIDEIISGEDATDDAFLAGVGVDRLGLSHFALVAGVPPGVRLYWSHGFTMGVVAAGVRDERISS